MFHVTEQHELHTGYGGGGDQTDKELHDKVCLTLGDGSTWFLGTSECSVHCQRLPSLKVAFVYLCPSNSHFLLAVFPRH